MGLPVLVHRDDWSASDTATLTGLDPADNYRLLISPPLSFVPGAGDVVEIVDYPTGIDPLENQLYKVVHAFLDPAVPVVTGPDDYTFTVDPADISKFLVGAVVLVHEPEWVEYSGEVKIASVDLLTYTVTVDQSLGYTPSAGDLVEFIGFADGGGAYRFT